MNAILPIGPLEYLIEGTVKAVVTARPVSDGGKTSDAKQLFHIRDFWKPGAIRHGQRIAIAGSLSVYAPFLMGSPKLKRNLHRSFRRAAMRLKKKMGPTFVDALMAYTAGQMVWRLESSSMPYVFMGIYHSIVRNSIPIFVDKSYYDESVAYLFDNGPSTIEAKVVGKVTRISLAFLDEYVETIGVKSDFDPSILTGDRKDTYALQIDGADSETGIERIGDSRYLDGDIWVAVLENGESHFVSRFLDLADPDDLRNERNALKEDADNLYPEAKLLAEFDQVQRTFGGVQQIDTEDYIRRVIDGE
jgi:hypothetical protein